MLSRAKSVRDWTTWKGRLLHPDIAAEQDQPFALRRETETETEGCIDALAKKRKWKIESSRIAG